jgi:hypothetical protein
MIRERLRACARGCTSARPGFPSHWEGLLAQIFPRWTNALPLYLAVVLPLAPGLASGFVWYYFSPEYTDVGYRPEQPVPYSHKLHVGELGLDCRYCHASVERSAVANIPPTQVCMNCHQVVKRDSELLAPILASAASHSPMHWIRVHDLPDYAYFDHSAHVLAGVGCASCHGPIHEMEVVMQVEPLSMGWCLDCHRNPDPYLRPLDQVTNMSWTPSADHAAVAARFREERGIAPPLECSGCHR